jgi:hypothetical protein
MKKIIYFIVPAGIAYVIGLFLLKLLLVDIIGLLYDVSLFDPMAFIVFNIIATVTFYPIIVMKFIYQLIRVLIDKEYRNDLKYRDSTSVSDTAEKHFQSMEVMRKNISGDYEGARRLKEHFDEVEALKEIAKNTRK